MIREDRKLTWQKFCSSQSGTFAADFSSFAGSLSRNVKAINAVDETISNFFGFQKDDTAGQELLRSDFEVKFLSKINNFQLTCKLKNIALFL